MPSYERNDEKEILEPVLLTLGGKDSMAINRIAQVTIKEDGERFIRIQTGDEKLMGEYDVKIYATEQSSGLSNQDAVFRLIVAQSVLTLTDTPNVCFLGKALVYEPKGPPSFVPLPQYGVPRAQLRFSIHN